jgi:hypothetical protein
LTPTSIVKEITALSNVYDVQGGPNTYGVSRIVDQYGNTLPTFSIEGTTGWQFHATDGFAFTGLESIAIVQGLLNQYASLNRGQQLANKTLYPLEYYDYFTEEFWTVVPIGPQIVRQDAARPLLFNYAFRFAAIGGPVGEITDPQTLIALSSDPTDQMFGVGGNDAATGLNGALNLNEQNYGGFL